MAVEKESDFRIQYCTLTVLTFSHTLLQIKKEIKEKLQMMAKELPEQSLETVPCSLSRFYIITKSLNARALIGQSAMVYCASKPMEKSRVLRIIIQKQ